MHQTDFSVAVVLAGLLDGLHELAVVSQGAYSCLESGFKCLEVEAIIFLEGDDEDVLEVELSHLRIRKSCLGKAMSPCVESRKVLGELFNLRV